MTDGAVKELGALVEATSSEVDRRTSVAGSGLDSSQTEALTRFAPAYVLDEVHRDPVPPRFHRYERLQVAVLLADITGFSALTRRLASTGMEGVERIQVALNRYFGNLIKIISYFGGDVVKFTGDAVVAIWPDRERTVGEVMVRAAECALDIQTALHDLEVLEDVKWSLRIQVDGGLVVAARVGGVLERWEMVYTGAPFDRIAAAKQVTQPGEVTTSVESWGALGGSFAGSPVFASEGRRRRGGEPVAYRLKAVTNPVPRKALARPVLSDASFRALCAYLPGVVLSRVTDGMDEWLGELRRIAVLFIELPLIDMGDDLDASVARFQYAVANLQECIYRYDGSVNKVAVDEKGCILVAAFGLPPLSHVDDPMRAVKAAVRAQRRLADMECPTSIGIATGRVFCGTIGGNSRVEYTMVGEAINLAARLMTSADGRILCDKATADAAATHLEFDRLTPMALDSHAEPVPVWSPSGRERQAVRKRGALVGRAWERRVMSQNIQGLNRAGETSTTLLIGDAGIGKSRLLTELVDQARKIGLLTFHGQAEESERKSPYFVWREVLEQYFELPQGASQDTVRARVLHVLAADPIFDGRAPLLNGLLPLDLPDSVVTKDMTGEARATSVVRLVVELLQRVADRSKLLLILEDAHWFDSASWALAREVVRDVEPMMLVIGTRPIRTADGPGADVDTIPVEYDEIFELEGTHSFALEGLTIDEVDELTRQNLAARVLPDGLAAAIRQRTDGNPLFTEQLTFHLRDTQRLLIEGDTCRLGPGVTLDQLSLPDSVQVAITERFDRLNPRSQLTLKVAAVIGRAFRVDLLADAVKATLDRSTLDAELRHLEHAEFLRPADDGQYEFRHSLLQDSVYALMLFEQRRKYHAFVANWYIELMGSETSEVEPLLAWHFERADEFESARDRYAKAAHLAHRRFANREAVDFYGRVFALDAKLPSRGDQAARAEWERKIAEAYFRLGDLEKCVEHGHVALSELGHPMLKNVVAQVGGLLGQVVLRVLQRTFPARFRVSTDKDIRRRLRATRLQNRLTEVAIYAEDAVTCLYSGLRELNISEPGGPSAELGRAYAVLAVVLGAAPMRKISAAWADRAIRAAEQAGNSSGLAYVLSRVAIHNLYLGEWKQGSDRLEDAIAKARRIGDRRLLQEALGIYGKLSYFASDFVQAMRLWEEVGESARVSRNEQTLNWSYLGRGGNMLRLGQPAAALESLKEAVPWAKDTASLSEVVWTEGLLALAYWRTGDAGMARNAANLVLPKIVGNRPVAYWTQQSNAAVAEVYADLLASSPHDATLRRALKSAVKGVRMFAKIFPFGQPHRYLWQGVYERSIGKTETAVASLGRAIEVSKAIDNHYEWARALAERAQCYPAGDSRRAQDVAEATRRFEALGCQSELERLDRL